MNIPEEESLKCHISVTDYMEGKALFQALVLTE